MSIKFTLRKEWFFSTLGFVSIASGLLILLNLTLVGITLNPQFEALESLEVRVEAIKSGDVSGEDALAYLVSKTQADVAKFKASLPSKEALTTLLKDVYKSAKRNKVKIPEGSYSPKTVEEASILKYTISLPVEGRYKDIKKFVYDIETLKRPLVVDEISFSRSKGSKGVVALHIQLSAYFNQINE
ncbi:MAG: type 4a pilus biogenesis protein PilO [Deltaproteobacteria bacterium]|nr:type 4a pilus biogenesis protein PilO [Deltaproteobacteria bacterium]